MAILGEKLLHNKKQLYGLVTFALISCILILVATSQTWNVSAPTQTQQSTLAPKATASTNQTSNPTNETQPSINEVIGQNVTCNIDHPKIQYSISGEMALNIAKPYIESYTKAHNRTVVMVDVKVTSIINESSLRPDAGWQVTADFDGFRDNVVAYAVLIYANNGEVRDNGPLSCTISEEQALNIAQSRIDSYIAQSRRTVKSITPTLGFVVTPNSPLGVPRWNVVAQFTDEGNPKGNYSVYMNGNTGEIINACTDAEAGICL
jgi:hypothetical protein